MLATIQPRSPFLTSGLLLWSLLSGCEAEETVDTGPDTSAPELLPDFIRVEQDESTLQDWGYTVEEWQLQSEAPLPYDSLFPDDTDESGGLIEYRPTFFALRPTDSTAETQHLLMWIHGGGVADDRDFAETGELPEPCQPDKIQGLVKGPINKRSMAIMAALDAGWWVLFPRNDWCDAWMGTGEDDPAMPNKFGNHHLHRVLDFAATGGLGTSAPEGRFLWGSSSGGNGALLLAAGRDDLSGVVVDSAPTDWVAYYGDDPELVESHFGGPPYNSDGTESAYFQAYLNASGPFLVSSGRIAQRLFVAWNTHDRLIPPVHGTTLIEALESSESREVSTYGHKDFNRRYPDPNFHVQVSHPEFFPAASAQVAMYDFLLGRSLTWLEAEESCSEGCPVGMVIEPEGSSPEHERALSNQSGRAGLANGSPGILAEWTWISPEGTEAVHRFRFAAAFESRDSLDTEEVVGRMHLISSDRTVSQDVLAGDLHFSLQHKPRAMLNHIAATTLEATVPPGEAILIQWEHTGVAHTLLDHVVVSSRFAGNP